MQWGKSKSRLSITLPTVMDMYSAIGTHYGGTASVNIITNSKYFEQNVLYFSDTYSGSVTVLWIATGN